MTSALNGSNQYELPKDVSSQTVVWPDTISVPDYSYGLGNNTIDAVKQVRNAPKNDVKWAVMAATGSQTIVWWWPAQMAFDTFTGNDSAMLDDANDRITVTKAGIYQITAQIYCGNGTIGTLYGLSIDINGTQEALQFSASSYGFSRAMANVSWVWFLSVWDHVTATWYGWTTEAGVKKNWVRVFQLASKTV